MKGIKSPVYFIIQALRLRVLTSQSEHHFVGGLNTIDAPAKNATGSFGGEFTLAYVIWRAC